MKRNPQIAIGVTVVILVAIALVVRLLAGQEEKARMGEVGRAGESLISLIAMYPIGDFSGERSAFMLRTLSEYTSNTGFAYFFAHDAEGQPVAALASAEIAAAIPAEVQQRSVQSNGLTRQSFEDPASGSRIQEFSKPVFGNGLRTGTVRLGLRTSPTSLFSPQRVSLLATIAFFMLAVLIFGYYGVTLALRPVQNLHRDIEKTYPEPAHAPAGFLKGGPLSVIVENLEQSLGAIKERLGQIEGDNVDLASRLGAIGFERNQVFSILDSIQLGIVITDIQENVTHLNEFMSKLLKQPLEKLLDRPFGEILDNDDIAAFLSQQETLGRTTTLSHTETSFPELAPGEVFQVSASYLKDRQGSPIGKLVLLKNVTSEKLAEKAREDFIAQIAHELLTPLTNIRSYSEMLMDGEVDDLEMQKEFCNTINNETNRLTGLVKNLLNLSKMEMGSLTLEKGLVRTDVFADDCLAAIEATAREKQISIEKHLPDNPPSLYADKELLKAAVINVLGNALKYTPEKGNISFTIRDEDRMLIFEIADTGYGISEEDLPRIFEKFYRSSNPAVTEQAGTGLGLPMTAEIVHLHDGKIEVQSKLGEGARFSISIPREEYHLGKQ